MQRAAMRTAQAQQHSASVQASPVGSKPPSVTAEFFEAIDRAELDEQAAPSVGKSTIASVEAAAPGRKFPSLNDEILQRFEALEREEQANPSLLTAPPSIGKETIFRVEEDAVRTVFGSGGATTKAADGAGRKPPKLKGPGGH